MANYKTPNSKRYEKDIYERVYQFALTVVKFSRKLPKTIEADVLRRQVIRSETKLWLRMIGDLYSQLASEVRILLGENEEIIKILATIVIRTKN